MTEVRELKDCNTLREDRFLRDDNAFDLLGMDHCAIPCADVELMARFVIEVLGGEPYYVVGFDQAPGGGRPKQAFLRVGNVLFQCSPPIDGVQKVGKDDPNPWPHWAFTTTAERLERNCERLRSLDIPVFGPAEHVGGDSYSAYFASPEGHKLEIVTYEDFPKDKTIGVFGAPGVGHPKWGTGELFHTWPDNA
jgi:catechol 2,3-dioxygenase-like lactoylglutathione lyase family enzyme